MSAAPASVPPAGRGARRSTELPLRYNAVEILTHNLRERPHEVALLTPDRELTFRQVSDEVSRVGHALRALGVRPGDCVALLCLDTAEWAVVFFACLKVGAVAVGLNTLLTPGEHARMLSDARVRVLVVHHRLLAGARRAVPSPKVRS